MYQTIDQIRNYFKDEIDNQRFTVSRDGSKTVELLGASFIADKPAIFGTPNNAYIKAEIEWYMSLSTNIGDIVYGPKGLPPEQWVKTANKRGEVNSNYGHLIFAQKYHEQYNQAMCELIKNPGSRRATMVYTRPSIWVEYNETGKNDFICTNAVTYYIRDNTLHCVVQMRSNDVVYGYKNDYAWQKYVLNILAGDLSNESVTIKAGNIYWQVQNLHVYERHFNMVYSTWLT